MLHAPSRSSAYRRRTDGRTDGHRPLLLIIVHAHNCFLFNFFHSARVRRQRPNAFVCTFPYKFTERNVKAVIISLYYIRCMIHVYDTAGP